MKATNFHWVLRSPFYLYKKTHLCPDCGETLNVVKRSEIMSYEKAKAKGIDLHITGMGGHTGKTKVIWWEFECPGCSRCVTVDEMKRREGYPD